MAVAGPVVGQHALLGGRLDIAEVGCDVALVVAASFGFGQGDRAFEHVQRLSGVAGGEADEMVERLRLDAHAALGPERPAEPAFGVLDGPLHQQPDLVVGQRFEAPHPQPGQERRVDLEIGVLGGRADERDRAVLDLGQERVLLGLVEAMDLVDEEDAAGAAGRQALAGFGDDGPDLDHAAHHGRERLEVGAHRRGQEAGEAGLAGAGRPPQQDGPEVAARHGLAERPPLADEVLLPDELVEGPRAHPGRERLAARRRLEQGFGAGSLDASAGHALMLRGSGRAAPFARRSAAAQSAGNRPSRPAGGRPIARYSPAACKRRPRPDFVARYAWTEWWTWERGAAATGPTFGSDRSGSGSRTNRTRPSVPWPGEPANQ